MMAVVGFVGLGSMGGEMVRHLIKAGHQLQVYARRADVLPPFVELGAKPCAHAADVARGADFVFLNVTTADDVASLLFGDGNTEGVESSAAAGTIICDFSTIAASAAREFAKRLAARGITYMDCPVSGGPIGAKAATLSIMVGGDDAPLAKVRPLLEKIGAAIFQMGPIGNGQVTKACNQIVQVVNIQGIAEALLFARANGVDPAGVVDALMAGYAGSKMLGLMGPKMAQRDFAAGIEARLHHKDFVMIADMVNAQALPMPGTELVLAQLNKLMEQGWGTMDTCNLLRVLETTAPPNANIPREA